MEVTLSGVEIRVRSNSLQARQDLSRLERSITNIERTTERAASGFRRLAIGITSAFAGANLVRGITRATDSIVNLENKMALVVGRGRALTQTMMDVRSIAAGARQPVSAAAETFNRFGLALREAGASADELLIATEAVLKSATLSGADSNSANAAIVQLGQGLASGQLRGEELNSVLEQIPRLAQAIADGMGIPFGELREAAKDGQVTAEAVFQAILATAGDIEEEFSGLNDTVGNLVTVLNDEFARALNELDKQIGFSEVLKSAIIAATDALDIFSTNLYVWVGLAKGNLALLLNEFTFFKMRVREILDDIFMNGIDTNAMRESITSTIEEMRNLVTERFSSIQEAVTLKIEPLDLSGYLPSTQEVLQNIQKFTADVIQFFKDAYLAIVGESWWGEIFWEGANRIGGPKFTTALEFVTSTLNDWSTSVISTFENIYKRSSEAWDRFISFLTLTEIDTPAGPRMVQTGFGSALDSLIDKAVVFRDTMAQAIEYTFATSRTREVTGPAGSTITVEQPTLLGKFLEVVSETGGDLVVRFEEVSRPYIDQLYELFEAGTIQLSVRASPVVSTVLSGAEAAISAYENGVLITQGFVQGVIDNKELLGLTIASAFIAAVKFGPLKTAITVSGLVLGPDVIESDSFQATARSIGLALGQAIQVAFKGDKVGTSIFTSIGSALSNLGGGLIEQLYGKDFESELLNGLVGALVVVLGAAAFSKVVRNALFSLGKKLVVAIFSSAVVASIVSSLATALASGLTLVVSSAGWAAVALSAGSLGAAIGAAITGAIAVALAGALAISLDKVLTEATSGVSDFVAATVSGQSVSELRSERANRTLEQLSSSTGDDSVFLLRNAIDGQILSAEDLASLSSEQIEAIKESIKSNDQGWASWLSGWTQITSSNEDLIRALDEASAIARGNAASESSLTATPIIPPAYKAAGGAITGPGGPTGDKIPAMLSDGEFVINAAAAKKLGLKALSMLNHGMLPQFLAEGTPTPFDSQIEALQQQLYGLEKEGETKAVNRTRAAIASLEADRRRFIAESVFEEVLPSAGEETSGATETVGGDTTEQETREEEIKNFIQGEVDGFRNDFQSALTTVLATGDIKGFFGNVLDSFTARILNTFSQGFTDALFEGLKIDEAFNSLFKGVFNFGNDAAEKTAATISDGITNAGGEGSAGLFQNVGKAIGGLFSNIFGGGEGGGAGFGTFFSAVGKIFGFANGGIVPSTSFSQAGKDSVPAMLTPGELVVPENKVDDFMNNKGSSKNNQTFNINVTGNIDAETRRNIVNMLPEITQGVNSYNRENNYVR